MADRQEQKKRLEHSPETFRNRKNHHQSNKQSDKSPNNETFHTTTLRYSNLGNSQGINSNHSPGIRCPESNVYQCQICSKLRLVCPLSNNKSYQNIDRYTFSGSQTNNHSNKFNTQAGKNIKYQRPQTPQFNSSEFRNGQYENLGIKFIDSLPYIPRPLTTSRKSLPKGIQLSSRMQKNIQIRQPSQILKIIPNRTVTQPSTQVIHSHVTTTRPTRIIEQIYYVPYIHNVLVPEIINPQVVHHKTPRTQKASHFMNQNNSNQKNSNLSQSPIRVTQYRQNGILTPDNFKKLADSLRRQR